MQDCKTAILQDQGTKNRLGVSACLVCFGFTAVLQSSHGAWSAPVWFPLVLFVFYSHPTAPVWFPLVLLLFYNHPTEHEDHRRIPKWCKFGARGPPGDIKKLVKQHRQDCKIAKLQYYKTRALRTGNWWTGDWWR